MLMRLSRRLYGWTLDLFDLERLRVQLVSPQRHLIAQHPGIFAPPFFPQRGGQSIAESRDTLLIDHVAVDHALATWLARRLSLAGFRTWCNGTAPLAGENADETVRKLLEVRANQYLPVITAASLADSVFLERCTIAGTKETPVLPCAVASAARSAHANASEQAGTSGFQRLMEGRSTPSPCAPRHAGHQARP